MLQRNDTVFIDTNAIAAAHAAKAWGAVRHAFELVTVMECVEEATRVNRRETRLVDKTQDQLAAELTVEPVDDGMRFTLAERLQGGVALDPGERDLLSLALKRGREVWCFCGPDKAALRGLHVLGWVDRMVSLEEMMRLSGLATQALLPPNTKAWLETRRTQLKLGDSFL